MSVCSCSTPEARCPRHERHASASLDVAGGVAEVLVRGRLDRRGFSAAAQTHVPAGKVVIRRELRDRVCGGDPAG